MAENKKRGILSRIATWFREMKSELKKVVWPTGKQVSKNTAIVIAVCIAFAIILGVMDLVLNLGVNALLKL